MRAYDTQLNTRIPRALFYRLKHEARLQKTQTSILLRRYIEEGIGRARAERAQGVLFPDGAP